jgi:hypothetical protein
MRWDEIRSDEVEGPICISQVLGTVKIYLARIKRVTRLFAQVRRAFARPEILSPSTSYTARQAPWSPGLCVPDVPGVPGVPVDLSFRELRLRSLGQLHAKYLHKQHSFSISSTVRKYFSVGAWVALQPNI